MATLIALLCAFVALLMVLGLFGRRTRPLPTAIGAYIAAAVLTSLVAR